MSLVKRLFPDLKEDLKLAQMQISPAKFTKYVFVLTIIAAFNLSIPFFFILLSAGAVILVLPFMFILGIILFFVFMNIPRYNTIRIRQEIEADIFIPARMLLTLLEGGNSLVTALEGVSYTKAKSSKYFGKIASEIYLGKNIDRAIDDGMQYNPSPSFKRVLEPIRNSLKTGTDIQKNLSDTLKDLSDEKVIEIEKYEKKLGAISLFYMLFGTIIPAVGIVIIVIGLSVLGLKIDFFPFLFLLWLGLLIVQMLFVFVFRSARPLMRI